MKIRADDFELFKKLGLKNVLDLALILPKKIENFTLSAKPSEKLCTQEVVILESSYKNGKFFGLCYCKNWKIKARFIFFHPSKWHIQSFIKNKECFFHSKMTYFNHTWQFINPKIIKEAGIFQPKFQLQGIKDESMKKVLQNYVNYENLKAENLEHKYINLLLTLHQYNQESFAIFTHLDDFKPDLKFIEIYAFLKRLRLKRQKIKAHKIELFDIKTWIENLAFKLTVDQLNAIADIRKDLSFDEAQRRVIMGDVGCGKTLVLLAAALSVYPKQALLMAPTSILAEQLYNEALKFLPSFMQIVLIKGGKKDKDLKQRLENAHLIIGTHALIHFKEHKAVLVMIDEQHRFGSNQRQKINDLAKKEGLSPHFIQFSATPIPRTLSMIQSELVNFSFIKQMPFKKDIESFCVQEKDFSLIKKRIAEELAKNNQIAIIYPLVNENENSLYQALEKAKQYWQKNYEAVFCTHGKDKNKDKILAEFKERGSILLATTVVEVGISLPRLSTIIIVGAERLGLATLHQLRGRVGRVGLKSYCYLYTKLKEIPQRLLDFTKNLDGFKIAELDLKNRLSGDLLDGFIQHGNEFKFFDFAGDEKILEQAKKALET